jgi:hypothetical protein
VLGTSIGLAIGYILGYIMGGPPFDFILAPALAMLLGGFAHWLALRRQTTGAGWWVALSTVGFTLRCGSERTDQADQELATRRE